MERAKNYVGLIICNNVFAKIPNIKKLSSSFNVMNVHENDSQDLKQRISRTKILKFIAVMSHNRKEFKYENSLFFLKLKNN